ncbi:hypothetical protein V2H45_10680 [Tumidithrix elongata RA019]|uniref:DUF11 domain-containing protein n=1 Tax=Tumidithrix elongata BACA0141 TaxID=2716417 RepID=A0AAW9PW50_9CYAN|nr:hypothetical protein [Tumidithrix elongata RA019]
MKHFIGLPIGLAALGALLLPPIAIASTTPANPTTKSQTELLAQRPAEVQPLKLLLVASLQVIVKDNSGNEQIAWQALNDNAQVVPGSILRYAVAAQNNTKNPISDLIVTQPIPSGMVYILGSATLPSSDGATVTYSIDGSKTFVAKPTVTVQRADGVIEVRPAPPEAYTHVRWNFGKNFTGKSILQATYQVRVK